MRIAGLYINGFGVFRDMSLDNIDKGLNIFLGGNESGKSTLLGFIRSILFGFPDGRSTENSFPPLAGGRHGGNLIINLNDSNYIVERFAGAKGGKPEILLPDHTRAGKEFLHRLLPINDRSLFNNIFAFSLSELQTLETLNSESVEEALYSAGAGINLTALASLRAATEKREGELFGPKKRNAQINVILARLIEITKEKKSLTISVQEYDNIMAQILSHAGDIDSLRKKRSGLSGQSKKMEQQSAILPEWINLVLAEKRLEALLVVDSFPAQGLTRLEGIKSRLNDLEKEQQEKEGEIRQREDLLKSLEVDEVLLKHASRIRRIEKDSVHIDAVSRDIVDIKQDLASGERKLREGLIRLGAVWNEQTLREFDLSIARREEVRRFRDALSEARSVQQRKKETMNNMQSALNEADRRFGDIREPVIKDEGVLKRLKQSCAGIKNLETEKRMLAEELRHSKDRLNDLMEEKNALEDFYMSMAPYPSFIGVFCFLFAALLVVSASGFIADWKWSIAGILLLALLALLTWILRSKTINDAEKSKEDQKKRSEQIDSKIEGLEQRISPLERETAGIDERIKEEKTILSGSAIGSALPPEEMEQRILNELDLLRRWSEGLRIREQAAKGLDEGRIEYEKAEEAYNNIFQEWQSWVADHDLEANLSPEGVLEILGLIESLKEQLEGLERARERMSALEKEKAGFMDSVLNMLESCGMKDSQKTDIPIMIHNTIKTLTVSEQAVQKRDMLLKEIETSKESLDRMEKQARRFRDEIQELIRAGGASEEEEFRSRGEIFEKRLSIKQEIDRCEDNIKRLSREPENIGIIIEEISQLDHVKLEEQKDRISKELEETEERLNALTREQAALEERARRMVNDERISELRHKEEGLKEELAGLSEEWIATRLVRHLIGMTRARYEKVRQPEVLSEGSRFFSRMTLERYKSIASPLGEKRIEVIDRDNNTRTVEMLSRGTAEQLYLALRFGFIREFSRSSVPLPVIMDDILVNFDPERAKETVKGIIELSEEHQVLFFTCHPYIAEMFQEHYRNIPVYTISEGGILKK